MGKYSRSGHTNENDGDERGKKRYKQNKLTQMNVRRGNKYTHTQWSANEEKLSPIFDMLLFLFADSN